MSTLTLQFFSQGPTSPGIDEFQSSKNPYSVTRTAKNAPTAQNIETFFTDVQKEPLSKRVHTDVRTPNVAVVDKLFQVQIKAEAPRDNAIKIWSELRSGSKTIGILSGVAAAGLILLSLQDLPTDIVVSLYVGAVAALCFAGWSLNRYHAAGKELAIWQSPGEDFAQRRKASLELPLEQISLKKCHYHHEQTDGSLLGVEMLFVFKRGFQRFAQPLLAKKCETPELKKQWVADFFKGNPLAIKFFVDNPHLIEEAGWDRVQALQQQFDQLVKLEDLVIEQFEKDQEAAKQKHTGILKAFQDKVPVVCGQQKITKLYAQDYFGMVMHVLQEECLTKIYEANKEHRKHLDSFYSEVYLQIRPWLEDANRVLLEGKPSTFNANGFAAPATFLPSDFQQKLDAVTANFPQNVIAKAKEKSPDDAEYRAFVDAVFTA